MIFLQNVAVYARFFGELNVPLLVFVAVFAGIFLLSAFIGLWLFVGVFVGYFFLRTVSINGYIAEKAIVLDCQSVLWVCKHQLFVYNRVVERVVVLNGISMLVIKRPCKLAQPSHWQIAALNERRLRSISDAFELCNHQ